ncbi:hypothetical protein EUX98_g7505 [Antrodiella citrinella]|uniref:Uncharacterized protein n=1 Tax=Antrodiella citrinella TaxID=2447956 RepID=A0A4S4MLD2_9APHY|nr:hypothetical protein EUX98_g7505 [Antrodiella citrinella]
MQTLAFKRRTNAEQRELGERYRNLTVANQQNVFVKTHATRYTQLARLPYFDLVRQVVIDPMHNLFLGIVKNHFYAIWVQQNILREKHELRVLHELLADFSLPYQLGKLPKDIGIPAGGSLTADQWKLLAIVYGPIIVPQLWRECLPDDNGTRRKTRLDLIRVENEKRAEAKKKKRQEAAKKKTAQNAKKTRTTQPNGPTTMDTDVPQPGAIPVTTLAPTLPDPLPLIANSNATNSGTSKEEQPYMMHPDDPANFLKLSQALRILTQHVLIDTDVQRAHVLLQEYCTELITLYGSKCIKPNHHYATHVAECVRDFGPLHDFWSFLFERLNKVLKSFNTNNHADAASLRMIHQMNSLTDSPHAQKLASVMINASSEARGTVAGLASWVAEVNDDNETGLLISLVLRLRPF